MKTKIYFAAAFLFFSLFFLVHAFQYNSSSEGFDSDFGWFSFFIAASFALMMSCTKIIIEVIEEYKKENFEDEEETEEE